MRNWFWPLWLVGNLAWLFGVPALYGVWLWSEVQSEYAAGLRVTTDGDSISIPIAGVAIANFAALIALNVCWGIYAFIKRRRGA